MQRDDDIVIYDCEYVKVFLGDLTAKSVDADVSQRICAVIKELPTEAFSEEYQELLKQIKEI